MDYIALSAAWSITFVSYIPRTSKNYQRSQYNFHYYNIIWHCFTALNLMKRLLIINSKKVANHKF